VVADPEATLRPGDLCAIAIRPGNGPWGRFIRAAGDDFQAVVKFFLGTVEGAEGRLFLVGQIVPPVMSLIPESEVASLHCVVGSCGPEPRMGEDERAAFALITPFAQGGTTQLFGLAPEMQEAA
jgi:hypothetical protein